MQFQGKLNEAEVREATRFIRPRGYGARMALSYTRLVVYALIVVFILYQSFVRHQHIPPVVLGVRLVILVVIGGAAYVRYRKGSREAVASLDASLPDTLRLSPEGIHLDGPNGAHSFQPWLAYKSFREGEHVVVLARVEKGMFNVLPLTSLGTPERETLRGMLQNWLPAPPKTK
ncbi:hypothetical protein [Acidipila sp. EB88]|uniref:hypothetical protein n=1 Tax=Acidipila sp. EB88 TaxID=2305226 RepID=UPI000F5FCE39|nr:hypothetical protein [Acidipila sp. EB88]RRA48308.1 hypothetical protein D1Y84_08425 [Acidipila sp. EB88]